MALFDFYKIAEKYISRKLLKSGMHAKTLVTDDYEVEYWDNEKNKDVLIFLYGFGASAKFQWYKQIPAFTANYRIIMPNLIGFGKTNPLSENKFHLQDQVDLVSQLIKKLELSKVSIVGISYGGLTAAEYGRQNSALIKSLVLLDAPVKYFSEINVQHICSFYQVNSLIEFFAPKDHVMLRKQLTAAHYKLPFIPDFILNIFHRKLCLPYLSGWANLMKSLYAEIDYYSEKEYQFSFPTLLIWGENDELVPVQIGEQLLKHIPESTLKVIAKTRHMPNLENARAINKEVLAFLRAH
jgi:abhydrolase domain-containing protein 6